MQLCFNGSLVAANIDVVLLIVGIFITYMEHKIGLKVNTYR